jgi:hypothetical protein
MTMRKTTLHLSVQNKTITTQPINIERVMYQGDSLWFCLALNPLSSLLNKTGYEYNMKCNRQFKYKIRHLLYVDDIKVYASAQQHLRHLLKATERLSNDIQMSFGTDKCKTQAIISGNRKALGFELSQ